MKTPLPIVVLLFNTTILLCSCSNKEYVAQRKAAIENSKTETTGCFIRLVDGTIKSYSALQLVTGVYTSPHLLADGKVKIWPYQIMAYQSMDHFAVAAKSFSYGGHKSNLAVETLPGFAVRIATGKLNVYVQKYLNHHVVVDEFFLQEGDGQILPYTAELMQLLIKSDPEALDFFNNNQKHLSLTKELKTTAKIYNNTYFMASAGK